MLPHGTDKELRNNYFNNPPTAPFFGGACELLVRNCKKAMYAVLGNRSITEDVLSSTMCLVEQTLNAKQLTPVSSDVKDLEAITPNHFLLGNKNFYLPYLPCEESHLGQIPKGVSANFERSK